LITGSDKYPVEAVLRQLIDALNDKPNAILIAPPGAGKTTMVAPALLRQSWCDGTIILLSPRRIAARMAAERIAELLGEAVGQIAGYVTRMDSKRSNNTRILVMTEGIFRARIIADPELKNISAVLFDEVHERSLDSDFGLALALEAQAAFRPDLRILAMSATLDGDRFASLMDDAPVICSDGKSWPLDIRYIGRRTERSIEQDVASAIKQALGEQDGDILAFLPGAREIDRTADALAGLPEHIALHRLHGSLDPAEQRAALRPNLDGKRKIILSTNIAETSLTIDGVCIVIDSGMARRSRFDKAAGVARLVTERASLSAATQRAGRAARQKPGVAYRLWEEAGNGGLPPFDPPEILESDLTPLLLDCASWGERDPAQLRWLDPPPQSALNEARKKLLSLGAIDGEGRITSHGTMLNALSLPPHLAHMMIKCAANGQAETGAMLALLMQERGLGGEGDDLAFRLDRFARDKSARAMAAKKLSQSMASAANKLVVSSAPPAWPMSIGAMVALAFPDRLSKRRDAKGESWLSAMGRGLRLDPSSRLISAQWIAVADVQGAASAARIMSAAAIEESELDTLFADQISTKTHLTYDRVKDRVEAKTRRQLGSIILAEGMAVNPDRDQVSGVLLAAVQGMGIDALPWGASAAALRQRSVFTGIDAISDEALLATLDEWLPPLLDGNNRLRDIAPQGLLHALENVLGYMGKVQVNNIAPARFNSPAGTVHDIDYAADAGPTIELRVQALFGLDIHPVVGAMRTPLVLSLTSPAGRPIQTTRDLPAFWRGSWADVAKEMRGRYPKHNWPDRPWEASASLKTKKAQARNT
jgi:ATP-dependent helicase HrpB